MVPLSPRARLAWLAHLFKAIVKQHHREMLPAFSHVLGPGSVVVEAGAHAGQFTKLMASVVANGRILALEPSSYAYDVLSKAMALKGLSSVTIRRIAVSSQEGTAQLTIPLKPNGVVRFGLSHFGGQPGQHTDVWTEEVPCITVDRLVEQEGLERVDLLKADIEGWEFEMIKGAGKVLERFRPALFLEMDPARIVRAGSSVDAFWAHLVGLGYRGFTYDPDQGRFRPASEGQAGDIWFFHKSDSRTPTAVAIP
ncbi:MAG: FkbM family methyltransferase [Alphaproteobacteria bacterium]|nr:FkbM family methyltransferase [Alphaproteobacteria bacterium]